MRISQRIAPRPKTSARRSSNADVAAGLLRRHVGRRAQDRAGLGVGAEAAVRAGAPGGADRGHVLGLWCARLARSSSATPPSARTLASPQSMTCTSPKAPTMMLAGFRSRWITPLAWA